MIHHKTRRTAKYSSFIWLLFLLLFPLPSRGQEQDANLLRELAAIVDRYEVAPEDAKLSTSYEALRVYGHLRQKTQVGKHDRNHLSDMKRRVLFDALARGAEPNAIAVGIGSTGRWMRNDQQNDYDANRPDELAKHKMRGSYMEGLSDLDFPIFGSRAIAYEHRVKSLLALGINGHALTEEDLERLEISFIIDDQIRDVKSNGDDRRFWRQMLDVERSSYHPEKYLTKGGKALYCLEHLMGQGAVAEVSGKAIPFHEWASRENHKVGPFGLAFLLGGCADMDYFLRHAAGKSGQEKSKTILQLYKYTKRIHWMMKAVLDTEVQSNRLRQCGLSETQTRDLLSGLRRKIDGLAQLLDQTREDQPWSSEAKFSASVQSFKEHAALACDFSHSWTLELGYALLELVEAETASIEQVDLLYQVAYDLETMHTRRYPHGYPNVTVSFGQDAKTRTLANWYNENQQQATLRFLEAFRKGRVLAEDLWLDREMPWRPRLSPMEIGPVKPPPIASVIVNEVEWNPQPGRPRKRTVKISGELSGLLKVKPDEREPWRLPPIEPEKLQVMQELSRDLWKATLITYKLKHLSGMAGAQLSGKGSVGKSPYISEFEIIELTKQLQELEEFIIASAERLDLEPSTLAFPSDDSDDQQHWKTEKITSSLQDIGDYLGSVSDAADHAMQVLRVTHDLAEQATEFASGPDTLIALSIKEIRDESATMIKDFDAILAKRDQMIQAAKTVQGLKQGDLNRIAKLAQQVDSYLTRLADKISLVAAESREQEQELVGALYELRKHLASEHKDHAELADFIAQWERNRKVLFEDISRLQQYANWIQEGGQLAKSAGDALDVIAWVSDQLADHQNTMALLDQSGLDASSTRMLLGLKYVGVTINMFARVIPIRSLREVIKGYAGLLKQAPVWATAMRKLINDRNQGQMIDYFAKIPAAHEAILTDHPENTPLGFYVDGTSLAVMNELVSKVICHDNAGTPSPPLPGEDEPQTLEHRTWLVHDQHSPEGYIELDADRYRRASLICAWYWRVYRKPIGARRLRDLVADHQTTIYGREVTETDLEQLASYELTYAAWREYLGTFQHEVSVNQGEFVATKRLLEVANEEFAKRGFLLHREDVYKLLRHQSMNPTSRLHTALSAFWSTISEETPNEVMPNQVRQMLYEKLLARKAVRKRTWEAALQRGPAGLRLNDIQLQFEETVVSGETRQPNRFQHSPKAETITVTREVEIPSDLKQQPVYVGRVWIKGHPTATCDFSTELAPRPVLRWVSPTSEEAASGNWPSVPFYQIEGTNIHPLHNRFVGIEASGLPPGRHQLEIQINGEKTVYLFARNVNQDVAYFSGRIPLLPGNVSLVASLMDFPAAEPVRRMGIVQHNTARTEQAKTRLLALDQRIADAEQRIRELSQRSQGGRPVPAKVYFEPNRYRFHKAEALHEVGDLENSFKVFQNGWQEFQSLCQSHQPNLSNRDRSLIESTRRRWLQLGAVHAYYRGEPQQYRRWQEAVARSVLDIPKTFDSTPRSHSMLNRFTTGASTIYAHLSQNLLTISGDLELARSDYKTALRLHQEVHGDTETPPNSGVLKDLQPVFSIPPTSH